MDRIGCMISTCCIEFLILNNYGISSELLLKNLSIVEILCVFKGCSNEELIKMRLSMILIKNYSFDTECCKMIIKKGDLFQKQLNRDCFYN